MKRTGLILLACLLLALRTMAQAPEKVAPDDLVVTAEIVNHRFQATKTGREKPKLILYTKLTIRNNTNHSREIITMDCSWDDSWALEGPIGFDVWGCDKNAPNSVVIPANKSLVFYCPLFVLSEQFTIRSSQAEVSNFRLGFIDLGWDDIWNFQRKKRNEIISSCALYWSNQLNTGESVTSIPEITTTNQTAYYELADIGK